ncbi:polysaccharide biosynthesis protein [Gemelliphila palaticanis]|uniref:Polysaccharide biosynthesis protein n=1 Tax=Gemelliphila palaticanis TaxID=81950 RepID=A0ABX2T0V5_9BACL|nr:nucleoside-diphosphate sugar epimerase/dehydratase [Gemella palaticanis]MBF0716073.1 polysaccharide biosynthesis protein [Gemella palaticanis]NYS48003.1 polysaccharide biosynthesis protein [Gemella palaticanis]
MDKLFNSKIYLHHRFKLIMCLDLITVVIGTLITIFLDRNIYITDMIREFSDKIAIFLLISVFIYYFSFKISGVNKALWSYLGIKEIINICMAVLTSSFICSILYAFIFPETFSKLRFFIFSPLAIIAGVMFFRVLYRALRESVNHKKVINYKNTLIIGAGDAGYVLLKELNKNNRFNAHIVGLIDDKRKDSMVNGVLVLGTTYDLPKIIERYNVELVFLAIPSIKNHDKNRILNILKNCKHVQVKVMKPGLSLLDGGNITNHIDDVSIEDLLGRGVADLSQDEIQSYLTGKRVLITGAGGSIGSQLAREVFNFKPENLVLLDINENSLYMLERDFDFKKLENESLKNVNYISEIVSIRDKEALKEVFEKYKPEVVFHAAAHKHVPLMERRPQEAIKNNVFGTKNVMDTAIEFETERFIMISTDKAVNPTNAMGASKRLTEIILQSKGSKYKTKFAAVRFGNVLGSNGSVIPIFKEQVKKGGPVTITHRGIIRYFMTIPEAAQLVLQAGYYANSGEIFLLDMGEPVKIIDLAKNLIQLAGLEPYRDIEIKEIGLRPGEKMYEELTLDYENSEPTDNKMIFKNTTLSIDKSTLDQQLLSLEKVINEEKSEEKIKEKLFEIINNYNRKD